MGNTPTVGYYQFDGWDLATKYGWMHSGPGVQAATLIQDVVGRMAERMITSGELVGHLLGGAQWAGAAASAAGQAMQRGAGQINQAAAEAATAQRCVTELGESFQSALHRVPSPNEIPAGLGDRFRYGAAEGFTALSPFVVQSPLHDAMEQHRELDQQATLALTNHMITSRDHVEALPAIAPPAPMVLAGHIGGAPGGGVGQPAGVVPTAAGFGGAPAATPPAATTAGTETGTGPGSAPFVPSSGTGGSRAGAGSFLQPLVRGADDTGHEDRYAQQADHIVGELPLVAPAVIGETPEEQRRRLGRVWGGQ